jgi:hypothetical protein
MKERFNELSKEEQASVELEYHQMAPEEFDESMSRAKQHSPNAIWLPPQLAKALRSFAESEGESRYQTMVRRWIKERLNREAGRL